MPDAKKDKKHNPPEALTLGFAVKYGFLYTANMGIASAGVRDGYKLTGNYFPRPRAPYPAAVLFGSGMAGICTQIPSSYPQEKHTLFNPPCEAALVGAVAGISYLAAFHESRAQLIYFHQNLATYRLRPQALHHLLANSKTKAILGGAFFPCIALITQRQAPSAQSFLTFFKPANDNKSSSQIPPPFFPTI